MNGEIERLPLSAMSPARFIRDFGAAGRPVVITGAVDRLDGTVDQLCAEYGDRKFIVEGHVQRRPNLWPRDVQRHQLPFARFVEYLRDGTAARDDIYLRFVSIADVPTAVSMNQRVTAVGEALGLSPIDHRLFLWLGPSGHFEPCHFDLWDGTLIQIHGQKRVTLFPPRHTADLYPFALMSDVNPSTSRVDISRPDFERFPRVARALTHKMEVVIGPGDLLYIPVNWWHEVRQLGSTFTCSVSRFWRIRPLRRCFTTRQLIVLKLVRALGEGHAIRLRDRLRRLLRLPPS